MNQNLRGNGQNLDAEGRQPFTVLESIINESMDLKDKFKEVVDSELIEDGLVQVRRAGAFIRSNWKIIIPTVAAIGIGTYIALRRSSKAEAYLGDGDSEETPLVDDGDAWSPSQAVSHPSPQKRARTHRRH